MAYFSCIRGTLVLSLPTSSRAKGYCAGISAARDPKETYPGNYVRVTTLNAGAGLESPIVFLVGLKELFELEQSLRLSDSEREALVRDCARKLYMAATRRDSAGHTLCGGAAGCDPSDPYSGTKIS